MKGDDLRAEQLATVLDGGPVPDDIDVLLPAVNRIRDVLQRLGPHPDHVASLLPVLHERLLAMSARPVVELAHPTLYVRDMDASLTFYRDALGLTVREEGPWLSTLDAGGSALALRWNGNPRQAPNVGDMCIEFRTDELDRVVQALRRRAIVVDVKADRHRGRCAELRDPDGYAITIFTRADATERAATRLLASRDATAQQSDD